MQSVDSLLLISLYWGGMRGGGGGGRIPNLTVHVQIIIKYFNDISGTIGTVNEQWPTVLTFNATFQLSPCIRIQGTLDVKQYVIFSCYKSVKSHPAPLKENFHDETARISSLYMPRGTLTIFPLLI